jgi:hypothetical protein
MILQRCFYDNHPPIITIPKCGTRFTKSSLNPTSIDQINIETSKLYPFDLFEPFEKITNNSILIWRNPQEHLISAIQTDYVWGNVGGSSNPSQDKGWNLDKIIENMINDNSHHWSPNLYKNIYKIWNKTPFKFIELNKLSTLIDSDEVYSSKDYDSHKLQHFISKDEILKLIPNEKLLLLYTMCGWDECWLKRMLNNENGLNAYDELIMYNDFIVQQEKQIDLLKIDIEYLKMKLKNKRTLI